MDRTERISAAEAALDAARGAIDHFEAVLDEFEQAQREVNRVSSYVGSENWFDDMDAHTRGEVSRTVKAGILSQDLGYDLIVDNRELALRMLELATSILRNL
ncbi:MAG: DUF4298 domain-containing protein [Atopobiaceae bacterium]|nr:DUF4298 domain-containing protein [Atopobiaceae bacterium]